MLSILIPVYNYAVFPLVLEVHQQCIAAGIRFEIVCQDDHSTQFIPENQVINQQSNCSFEQNTSTLGRAKNRNILIQKAQFDWILLLDCDTFPRDAFFIKNYLAYIQKPNTSVAFGGIIYHPKKPPTAQLLRWVYGQKREALPCAFRNKKPNSRALTSNLLLSKKMALQNPFPETITTYGYEDVCFLSDLAQQNISVFHLDNPTFHLNLETSTVFLSKTETALKNLAFLIKTHKITAKESKITAIYLLIQKLKLQGIISWMFQKTKSASTKNLLSENPSLWLFDWYKLGYLCLLQPLK